MEETASGIALRVPLRGGTALWISLAGVADIHGWDGPSHSKPRREQGQYAVPVKKVQGNEIWTQTKAKKMAN